MAKVSKKSLEAKAYINGKVNDMREKFKEASDEEAKKQLLETFRETTSSDEYQENLKIVREDTETIRRDWRKRTSIPYRTKFYGGSYEDAMISAYSWWPVGQLSAFLDKNEIGQREKVKDDPEMWIRFLFKKFWNGDKTLDFIMRYASGQLMSNQERSSFVGGDEYLHFKEHIVEWLWYEWAKKLKNISLDNLHASMLRFNQDDTLKHPGPQQKFSLEWHLLSHPEIFSASVEDIINYVKRRVEINYAKELPIQLLTDWLDNYGQDSKDFAFYLLNKCERDATIIDNIDKYWLTLEEKRSIIDSHEWVLKYYKELFDRYYSAVKYDWGKIGVSVTYLENVSDDDRERERYRKKYESEMVKLQDLWEKLWITIEAKQTQQEVEDQQEVEQITETIDENHREETRGNQKDIKKGKWIRIGSWFWRK